MDLLDYEVIFGETAATQSETVVVGDVHTTYRRYGKTRTTADEQVLTRTVTNAATAATANSKAYDTWANRATASYTDIVRGR